MEGLKRCPQCLNLQPEIIFESNNSITIVCKKHGYEMIGDSLEQAIEHWNHVVDLIHTEKVA